MIRITYDAKTTLSLDQLVAFQGEAKTISQENRDKLRRSIKRHGFFVPIFVWQKTPKSRVYILDGHQRLAVLQQMRDEGEDIPPLPVEYITAKSRADAAEKLLAITSQFGEFNEEGLLRFAEENRITLKDLDIRLVDTEFVIAEDEPKDTEGDDDIPEAVEAVTKPGDLYLLGEHRLLCGDATRTVDVERLMNGAKADLVFADPPYGVDYDGGTVKRQKLKGDDTTALYDPCCRMAFDFSGKMAPLYLWHAGVKGIAAAAAAAAAGYEIRCEIVWNKNQAQFGALSAQYKQKHEPCYYCFKCGSTVNWRGPKNEVTVWDIDRAAANEYHPTQKPVELSYRAVGNHDAALVMDLFFGSGSTLIASEKLNRKCYGMEIESHYCDVTIQRYRDWCQANGRECVVERIPADAVQ